MNNNSSIQKQYNKTGAPILVDEDEINVKGEIPVAQVLQFDTSKTEPTAPPPPPSLFSSNHVAAAVSVPASCHPPKNCPDGGQWGIVHHVGNKTGALTCLAVMACGLLGLFVLVCPQDQRDAYLHNGKIYDASGVYLGREKMLRFTPTRNKL